MTSKDYKTVVEAIATAYLLCKVNGYPLGQAQQVSVLDALCEGLRKVNPLFSRAKFFAYYEKLTDQKF